MNLVKRDCGINMRLVPYGAGWTDVYLDIGNDSHYFIISYVWGDQFNDLIKNLYYMYPNELEDNEIYQNGTFEWDEEDGNSKWTFEREKNRNKEFDLKITIEHNGNHYEYTVRYKEFCYAVAKACTEALKECGFVGYKETTYTQDINLRELIYLKAIALDCIEAVSIVSEDDNWKYCSDFNKEIEILLFDM